jgi:hypothetical protein
LRSGLLLFGVFVLLRWLYRPIFLTWLLGEPAVRHSILQLLLLQLLHCKLRVLLLLVLLLLLLGQQQGQAHAPLQGQQLLWRQLHTKLCKLQQLQLLGLQTLLLLLLVVLLLGVLEEHRLQCWWHLQLCHKLWLLLLLQQLLLLVLWVFEVRCSSRYTKLTRCCCCCCLNPSGLLCSSSSSSNSSNRCGACGCAHSHALGCRRCTCINLLLLLLLLQACCCCCSTASRHAYACDCALLLLLLQGTFHQQRGTSCCCCCCTSYSWHLQLHNAACRQARLQQLLLLQGRSWCIHSRLISNQMSLLLLLLGLEVLNTTSTATSSSSRTSSAEVCC